MEGTLIRRGTLLPAGPLGLLLVAPTQAGFQWDAGAAIACAR